MDWKAIITADQGVMGGKPVIAGTRLTVEFVLGLLADGWPEEEIAEQYEINPEQIRACLAYAAEALAEEHVSALPMTRPRG